MSYAIPLGIIVAVVAMAMWYALRFSSLFLIQITDGHARCIRGKVPAGFLKDVETICKLWSISRGQVKGFRGPRRIRIQVGGGIEQQHRQAFQNAWNYPME